MNTNLIISIGRECGSGAHEIGEKLAAWYGIKLYDKNLLNILADRNGRDVNKLFGLDERVTGQILPAARNGFAVRQSELMNIMTRSDILFLQQKALIEELAGKESFVIIGHAANAILADCPNTLRLFLYASDELKIPRVREYYHLDTDREAEKKMRRLDRQRKEYFEYYTDMIWGAKDGHDFMIDTGMLGIDGTVELIKSLADRKLMIKKAA